MLHKYSCSIFEQFFFCLRLSRPLAEAIQARFPGRLWLGVTELWFNDYPNPVESELAVQQCLDDAVYVSQLRNAILDSRITIKMFSSSAMGLDTSTTFMFGHSLVSEESDNDAFCIIELKGFFCIAVIANVVFTNKSPFLILRAALSWPTTPRRTQTWRPPSSSSALGCPTTTCPTTSSPSPSWRPSGPSTGTGSQTSSPRRTRPRSPTTQARTDR